MQRQAAWQLRWSFSTPLYVFLAVQLVLFGVFVRYDEGASNDLHVARYYGYLRDVAVMIFVGFGFLMTFLRNYSYSAVGLNFLCAAVSVIEFIFVGGATQQVIFDNFPHKILLDLPLLIDGLFCAAAGMIAFGAVLGKATPAQIFCLIVWQVPFYALNQHLVFQTFKALDIGGSISIHAFGAYYGLAASLLLSKPGTGALEHPANRASYITNITAMIGTLFLWLYWPSFNGALASWDEVEGAGRLGEQQFLCIVNTQLSLLGATIAVFATSGMVFHKFDMFQVQNATLAGGVAMGAAANLRIAPVGALAVGICAGTLSTLGFGKVMAFLEKRIGLRDTCGIHYLHGLPGLMGGLVAAIASVAAYSDNEALLQQGHAQFGYQILAMVVTVAIAVSSGALGAWLACLINPSNQDLPALLCFDDGIFWADVDDETDVYHKAMKIGASNHTMGNSRHGDKVGRSAHRIQVVMDCPLDLSQSDAIMAAMAADTAAANMSNGSRSLTTPILEGNETKFFKEGREDGPVPEVKVVNAAHGSNSQVALAVLPQAGTPKVSLYSDVKNVFRW